MGRIFYVLLLFSISIFSCKKESEIIKGNQAPFDGTISNEYREDFIRKSYLYLIGKAPSAIELDSGMMILRKNNCSVNNREEFLDGLFNQEVYRLKLYSDITSAFLNNISDNTIDQYLIFIQDELNKPSNLPNYGILLKELEAMQKLDSLKNKFRNSLVGTVEAHKITVNTIAYEDIVGKGEAWAIGLFADFLNRQPTLSEIENIDDMLGNQTGTLFNSEGDSKEDIIEILFSSNEYFEKQVHKMYNDLLYRNANSTESVLYSYQLMQWGSISSIQKSIMLSNEFLGIQ